MQADETLKRFVTVVIETVTPDTVEYVFRVWLSHYKRRTRGNSQAKILKCVSFSILFRSVMYYG
jgi:hypothetical protein